MGTVEIIEDVALKAATDYINQGVELNTSLVKLSRFYQLSPEMIARAVERANRLVYLRLYKSNTDKTFSFPLASTDYILRTLNGSPATNNDSLYNLDDVILEDPVDTPSDFYSVPEIVDPEDAVTEKKTETKMEITIPKGIDKIYLNITDNDVRPNKVAVARLLSQIKEADEQIKMASFSTGTGLTAIKELFMKLIRAGSSVKDVISGVFSKLPIRLKKKAVPVVQNIVDDLHRTGKIMEKADVNTAMLKFGSLDNADIEKIASDITKILDNADSYQQAVIKKASKVVVLDKLAQYFPELTPLTKTIKGGVDGD